MSGTTTHLLGYPRIGEQRELKKAVESYWRGASTLQELEQTGRELRTRNWKKQAEAGVDLLPCNDFSFYDQVLDTSCLLGHVPPRFDWDGAMAGPEVAFQIARGGGERGVIPAGEMTKWFDTNYHYIVPEFRSDTVFKLSATKVFDEFAEAKALGYRAKPVLLGPVSYLTLGKAVDPERPGFDRYELLDGLLAVYEEILGRLAEQGAEWIQLDEPALVLDLDDRQREAFAIAYPRLKKAAGQSKLLLATYFGEIRENGPLLLKLPVDGIHIDAVRASGEVAEITGLLREHKVLSLGIVDGRNVWRNDFDASLPVLKQAKEKLGNRLWISASCSLLHSPITLSREKNLEIAPWLAFADEKLREISILRDLADGHSRDAELEANRAALRSRRESARIHRPEVKERLSGITPLDSQRTSGFPARQIRQRQKLKLPVYPTTTIGSFPQTDEVRATRAKWKKGLISEAVYDDFVRKEIRDCVAFQEEIGIDMPVHGEFERNDMVEYFGEQLEGFAFTANGWVQSYGSRCVKPPLIYGDVWRSQPMTVSWSQYAQTLTARPMKGMLTGPVTILQWSFVRDDQPREATTRQIALAIRDEVQDLEAAGLAAIQIDEPAIREGLPLRRADWEAYLAWAVEAFRLCSSGVRDETQIHTHMCYSEFNDIIEAIATMDADVITIETSRSNMELLEAFGKFRYPNEIGPGVYDIHSPQVPETEAMVALMEKAAGVIEPGNLWVNPDCGLKTRGWEETREALRRMVAAARELRDQNARLSGHACHG